MARQFSAFAAVLRALLLAGGLTFLFGPVLLPNQFGPAYLSYVGAGILIGLIIDAGLRTGIRRGEATENASQQTGPEEPDSEALDPEEGQPSEVLSSDAPQTTLTSVREPVAAHTLPIQVETRLTEPIGGRVLVAEDNPINARLAQCMLQRAGCIPILVETGRAAVDAVRKSVEGVGPAIDLVLMDVHMPDLDGLAASREIRMLDQIFNKAATGRKTPPLIAVTADAFAEDRARCLEAGMDDYLSKPFSWPELHTMLMRWLPRPVDADTEPGRADSAA